MGTSTRSGYVIWRYAGQRFGAIEFVSDPGSNGTGGSFSRDLRKAKLFASREAAERERCPENERVSPVDNFLRRPQ